MKKMTAVLAAAVVLVYASIAVASLNGGGTCTISVPATAPTVPLSGLVIAGACSAASKSAINGANWTTIYNQGAATLCVGFTTSVSATNAVDSECWPVNTLTERSLPFGPGGIFLRSTSGSLTVSVMTGKGS